MQGRKKYFLAIIAAAALAALFAAYEVLSFSRALGMGESAENMFFRGESSVYPSSVEISDPAGEIPSLGFASDTSEINFGIVPGGGNYATKFIDISNRGNIDVMLILRAEGNISGMVEFGRNRFTLGPGESAKIPARLLTAKSAGTGNYSGRIFVSRVMAKSPVSSVFLGLL